VEGVRQVVGTPASRVCACTQPPSEAARMGTCTQTPGKRAQAREQASTLRPTEGGPGNHCRSRWAEVRAIAVPADGLQRPQTGWTPALALRVRLAAAAVSQQQATSILGASRAPERLAANLHAVTAARPCDSNGRRRPRSTPEAQDKRLWRPVDFGHDDIARFTHTPLPRRPPSASGSPLAKVVSTLMGNRAETRL